MNAIECAELPIRELTRELPEMPFSALLELNDTLTERLLLTQDAARGFDVQPNVIGLTDGDPDDPIASFGDSASELSSDFSYTQGEMEAEDGPVSIDTLEDWLDEPLFVRTNERGHQIESYAEALRRKSKQKTPAGRKAWGILKNIDDQRLIAGQELDVLHGGDWQEWASSQFQPTRVDEDYVPDAPLMMIDADDDPAEAEKFGLIRAAIDRVHEEIEIRRRVERLSHLDLDDDLKRRWVILDLPVRPRQRKSAVVPRDYGLKDQPEVPWFHHAEHPDAGMLHEIPEDWYHALNRKTAKRHRPRPVPTQAQHRAAIEQLAADAKERLHRAFCKTGDLQDWLTVLPEGSLKAEQAERDLDRAWTAVERERAYVQRLRAAWRAA